MAIKVSVIVPVYNVERYLSQCLDSILNQTFHEFEIIIVDDGSEDGSSEIIREYSKKYPKKIKAFFQENKGQSVARNFALKHAEGEYVAFVDSDDYIGNDYIEILYNNAIEKKSDMVICNYTKVTENGENIRSYDANYIEGNLRIPSYISCNKLVRRKLLEDYNIQYKEGVICEDIPFVLKIEAVAKNVCVIPMAGYFYRTNPKSTTLTFRKKKFRMDQLPFLAMREAVEFCLAQENIFDYKKLEFFVCRIWTSLLFEIGKGCEKEVQREMCREIMDFEKSYFPKCYQNPYIKLSGLKNIPLIPKIGTWMFVQAYRMNVLYFLARIYSKV